MDGGNGGLTNILSMGVGWGVGGWGGLLASFHFSSPWLKMLDNVAES
ncbi:hypothetical protein NWP17_16915 [Chrysosporum bergii ANA360D]|uniref:Uncharacterized protein n=1 Tax=Chrysosporum bergii ANA360D TaxID=617107 RepID=A0AA43GUY2_9CYAN|nr:hypothetical protein [Chrysosporum bergii]MDH6062095.1 hypothetical protein [Chrysosporum bergii ANA360D]